MLLKPSRDRTPETSGAKRSSSRLCLNAILEQHFALALLSFLLVCFNMYCHCQLGCAGLESNGPTLSLHRVCRDTISDRSLPQVDPCVLHPKKSWFEFARSIRATKVFRSDKDFHKDSLCHTRRIVATTCPRPGFSALLSWCLSTSRCINGYRRNNAGGGPGWTCILFSIFMLRKPG